MIITSAVNGMQPQEGPPGVYDHVVVDDQFPLVREYKVSAFTGLMQRLKAIKKSVNKAFIIRTYYEAISAITKNYFYFGR